MRKPLMIATTVDEYRDELAADAVIVAAVIALAAERRLLEDAMRSAWIDHLMTLARVDICYLKLPARTQNCLRRSRINTIGDLLAKSVSDLRGINNLGKTSIMQLIEILGRNGLALHAAQQRDDRRQQ